jgi:hypothetical protein
VHFKGIFSFSFSLGLVLVASVALVSASGAGTTAAKSGTRIDVSTRASIVHYLRSIHVNPKGVVIQRGLRNYAGPSCPGRAWRCARTQHAVVQIARPGGMNRFLCRTARCAVLQVAAAASRNSAICIKTTGLGASCSITQSNSAGNTALIWEDAGKLTGLTQTAVYSASIVQRSASGPNLACVHQSIFIDGSTTNTRSTGATVTLEAHQSIFVKQDSTSGSNTAENAANPSTGVYTCASTAVSQDQKLTSTATSRGLITQNENAAQTLCPDGVSGDYFNMCLDIEQNQSTGFKGVATGTNNATFAQTNTLSAIANSPTAVNQTQSSHTQTGDGGLVGTINQDSMGVSTAIATQSETQCEDAATTGLALCDTDDADASEAPASLTQTQYGPEGIWKPRNRHRGRQFHSTFKGLGTATQTGNSQDTFTINQTSKQDNDQGSGSTQTNTVKGDCSTPGNCTDNQTVTVNGQTTTNTQSGQNVNAQTTCSGSTCTTGTNTVLIAGTGDFGDTEPNDNLAQELTGDGYTVTESPTLPADLSSFGQVWWVAATPPTADEQTQLVGFANSGRGVFLTGENDGCCGPLNAADQSMVNSIVTVGGITVGGQEVCCSGIPTAYPVNSSVVGNLATQPHTITDWTATYPGAISGMPASSVFAYYQPDELTTQVVAAAWDRASTVGNGRLVVFMDINWAESFWEGANWSDVAENGAFFLSGLSSPPSPILVAAPVAVATYAGVASRTAIAAP